MLITMV